MEHDTVSNVAFREIWQRERWNADININRIIKR